MHIHGIKLSESRPETFTQAYHAGILVAMVENYLPNDFKVNLAVCMVNFHSLREVFGERLWQKLKSRVKFRPRIKVYEMLAYQPFLPRTIIGGSKEFCLGYVQSHKRSRTKLNLDLKRSDDLQTIKEYLQS